MTSHAHAHAHQLALINKKRWLLASSNNKAKEKLLRQ